MKKLLILLLFVPLLSIGQTFTSSSVVLLDVDEHGIKRAYGRTEGQSIITIGENKIYISMLGEDPRFMEIESITRDGTIIYYDIKDSKYFTTIYYDNVNDNVKAISMGFFSLEPGDDSGHVFIFEDCKLIK